MIPHYLVEHAIREGNTLKVALYAHQGFDPNVYMSNGKTTLVSLAMHAKNCAILGILQNLGADFTKRFLDNETNMYNTYFTQAISYGYLEVVEFLHCTNVAWYTPGKDMEPMTVAAASGSYKMVKLLISLGYHQSACQYSTFWHLLRWDNIELTKAILPIITNPNTTNERGISLLMLACQFGAHDMATHLIKLGADLNIVDDENKTALHYAVETEEEDIVRLLLDHNIDKSVRSTYDRTALELAIEYENQNICSMLTPIQGGFSQIL